MVARTANACYSRSCWPDVVAMRQTIRRDCSCLCWTQSKPKLLWIHEKSSLFLCHEEASEPARCLRKLFSSRPSRIFVASGLCAMFVCFSPTARAYCVLASGFRVETHRSDQIASSSNPVISRFDHRQGLPRCSPLLAKEPLDGNLGLVDAMLFGTALPRL